VNTTADPDVEIETGAGVDGFKAAKTVISFEAGPYPKVLIAKILNQ